MPDPLLSAVRTDVHSFVLDGDVILLDELHSRLFALNSTASFVWLQLAAGRSCREAAERLSEASGVAVARVARDIDGLLAQWSEAGILRAHEEAGTRADASPTPSAPSTVDSPEASPRLRYSARGPSFRRTLQLMDADIQVIGDAELAEIFDAILGHLAAPVDAADIDRSTNGPTEGPTLELFEQHGRFMLVLDGAVIGSCTERDELVPLIHGSAAMLMYRSARCFSALHAAAVARGERCAVMPGPSGCGKSTLTAALVASGYRHCSDDLVILDGEPLSVRPVPLRPALKSGAWSTFEQRLPELAALPAYRRRDGKRVKYLPPSRRWLSQEGRCVVAALVFPCFAPDAAPRLRAIPRGEALARVTEAGYDVPGGLDAAWVRRFLAWLETVPCHELSFGHVDDAVELFATVLP